MFSQEGLVYAGVLALLAALGGGAAFSAVEKHRSTWDGVWWAVTTMTTVGYGDLSPQTTAGRIIGIVVMLVGIGFVALLTGAIAQRFLVRPLHTLDTELASAEELDKDALAELSEISHRIQALETVWPPRAVEPGP